MVRDNWLHRIETGMGMRIIFLAGCARRASGMVFQQPIHELQMMLPAWERRSPDGELLEKETLHRPELKAIFANHFYLVVWNKFLELS